MAEIEKGYGYVHGLICKKKCTVTGSKKKYKKAENGTNSRKHLKTHKNHWSIFYKTHWYHQGIKTSKRFRDRKQKEVLVRRQGVEMKEIEKGKVSSGRRKEDKAGVQHYISFPQFKWEKY